MNAAGVVVGTGVLVCAVLARRARRLTEERRIRARFASTNHPSSRALPRIPGAPEWLAGALADADVPLDADRAWASWVAIAVAAALGGAALGGPVLAAGGLLVGVACPPAVLRARRGAATASAEAALPAALEAVARGLRSGGSLRQAIAEAAAETPGALGADLRLVAAASDRGTPLVDALEAWGARSPSPGVRLSVAALCLGAETGGAQARAVDGVAATLRERLAVEGEVRALTSQTRASMLLIAAAPLVFCAFASTTDPRTSTFLFRSPVGWACLCAGIGLDGIGALWMRRLCRVTA